MDILTLSLLLAVASTAAGCHADTSYVAKTCEVYARSVAIEVTPAKDGLKILMFDRNGVAFHLGGMPYAQPYKDLSIALSGQLLTVVTKGGETYVIGSVKPQCLQQIATWSKSVAAGPNNSFKPNPLRSSNPPSGSSGGSA